MEYQGYIEILFMILNGALSQLKIANRMSLPKLKAMHGPCVVHIGTYLEWLFGSCPLRGTLPFRSSMKIVEHSFAAHLKKSSRMAICESISCQLHVPVVRACQVLLRK